MQDPAKESYGSKPANLTSSRNAETITIVTLSLNGCFASVAHISQSGSVFLQRSLPTHSRCRKESGHCGGQSTPVGSPATPPTPESP